MRTASPTLACFFAVALSLWGGNTFAQNAAPANVSDKKTDAVMQAAPGSTDIKTNTVKPTEVKTDAAKAQPVKKMVQDATINLQTTITGNQEQPRVLYILPWQSPAAANVDFESLDSEQKSVFGHVEREELRRELESSDEAQ